MSSIDEPEDRPRRRPLVVSAVAFAWVFMCGVAWIASGARHDPSRWMTSFMWGFGAALPGFIAGLAVFFSTCARLIRGKFGSFGALTLAGSAVGGALLMDLMVWDIVLDQLYPRFFAHGRRLHREGRILAARAAPGTAWIADGVAPLEVPAEHRQGVAAQWRENAAKEHASIAAFAHLTIDLLSVGAPAALVAAVQRASLDEVRHAELSYAVARAIDERDESPAPFPEAITRRALSRTRNVALAQIAVDALSDGALNEGIAARLLARLSGRSASAELRDVLRAMASDEARHARDSWDIIAWCLGEGGELVRRALGRAADTMPAHLGSPLPDAARDGAWTRWGVQGVALEVAEYAIVRHDAQRRLSAMLATDRRAA